MYGTESKLVWCSEAVSATAQNLASAGDHAATFKIVEPIRVIEVGALITTIATVASTVAFDRRVTVASDSNRGDADVGAVTIPASTAVGKYVFSNAIKIDLDVGDEVVPQVTSAGTGYAQYYVKYFNRNEVMSEEGDAVESA